MNEKLKIALLCNNRMAIMAMQKMADEGVLCSVATADNDPEIVHAYCSKAAELKVPYRKIPRKNCSGQLNEWLEDVQPDMVFVMTFPWRIPAEVLAIPRQGFLNFHYGLLPEMRGADPIFESIRRRMPVVGATVHVMDEGLDTGPIVLREEIPLPAEYTYGMASSQMAWLGDKLCTQLIADMKAGKELGKQAQDETKAKYWPKVGEAELTIRWGNMESGEIMALVRSCNPIAKGVPTSINGWKIGVCDVSEINLQGATDSIVPGTIVVADQQNGMIVYCKDGKGVKLEVVHTGEGVFPGYKLAFFGIGQGMVFGN